MLLDLNDKAQVEKYNSFVYNSPHGTFYQDIRWAEVKSNWIPRYFYIERDGEIVAALSTLSILDNFTGSNLMLGTRGPVCDLHDIDLVTELFDEVKEYARANDIFLVRIDPQVQQNDELLELYKDTDYPIQTEEYKMTQYPISTVLEIKGRTADEILMDLSKSVRKDVRKAHKNGVKIVEGTREDLPLFGEFVASMSERKGIAYRNTDYFTRIYDAFGDDCIFKFAEYEGEKVAGRLNLVYGDRLMALYSADPLIVKQLQSYALRFSDIEDTVRLGKDYFDTGGVFSTDMDDGLYFFKSQFSERNVHHWIGTFDIVLDDEIYDKYLERSRISWEGFHGRD